MILFDSKDYCFLAKPCGVPTIPAVNVRRSETFLEEAENLVNSDLWVIHRLDRETSGVIVFAKNEYAHREACMAFEARLVKKTYWFIAEGESKLPIFRVDTPIDGKRSRTQFRVLDRGEGYFCGEATPLTGRKHQIRIHLSSLGHPILGDLLYKAKGVFPPKPVDYIAGESTWERFELPHFYLHARALKLPNLPLVEAPLPEDWKRFWKLPEPSSTVTEDEA